METTRQRRQNEKHCRAMEGSWPETPDPEPQAAEWPDPRSVYYIDNEKSTLT